MLRTFLLSLLALLAFNLAPAQAGWHHRHAYYAYPAYAAYPVAAYYPLAPAVYQYPFAPQVNVDEAQLARLLQQSLGAARARNFSADAPSAEMIQVQQDLASLKTQLNNIEAKVQEHDAQIRSVQDELRAIKAQLMK